MSKNTETFEDLVGRLKNDASLDIDTKVYILSGWKEKLVSTNANSLMDKSQAEKHFQWLGLIDETISQLKSVD